MRRYTITFMTGFVAGVVCLYVVLWTGGVLSPYLSQVRAEAVRPLSFGSPITGLTAANLHDTFAQTRNGHPHDAIDIMEPRGTPVRAVADGRIEKLFVSKAGGNTIYQFDIPGEYCYYYAHLDRYAEGVREGMPVKQGDLIAYVGSTGDASPDAPHLHFEIHVLGPDKRWWQGTPINPYPVLLSAVGHDSLSRN